MKELDLAKADRLFEKRPLFGKPRRRRGRILIWLVVTALLLVTAMVTFHDLPFVSSLLSVLAET